LQERVSPLGKATVRVVVGLGDIDRLAD